MKTDPSAIFMFAAVVLVVVGAIFSIAAPIAAPCPFYGCTPVSEVPARCIREMVPR